MRITNGSLVESRNSNSRKPYQKYYLAFEGEVTEYWYFAQIIKKQLKPGIQVKLLTRPNHASGWSNPTKILELLDQSLSKGSFNLANYRDIIRNVQDYFANDLIKQKIYKTASKYLDGIGIQLSSPIDTHKILEHMRYILESALKNATTINEVIADLKLRLKTLDSSAFDSNYDKVAIIVDRDMKSFTANQFDTVYNKCVTSNIGLYMTNPKFEMWLLLHFLDLSPLSYHALDTMDYETELNKYVHYVNKRTDEWHKFIGNLKNAIRNANKMENNIRQLKTKHGTNVHSLISSLIII